MVKLKVGADVEDDARRMRIARETMGEGYPIAMDANQRWDVADAVAWLERLAPYDPAWIEEPTSPDDVLAHAAIRRAIAPLRVATGEQMQNRIIAKQLLQAGALDVLQLDASRVGGVNENIAILLLAAKFDIPVCPHAGGVGLCELVQHYAFFDAAAVAGPRSDRYIEYVHHLHEHFEDPVVIDQGSYAAPTNPGSGARMHERSVQEHLFPQGDVWKGLERCRRLLTPPPPAPPVPLTAGPTDPSGLSGAAAPDAPARRRRNPLPELGFGAAQLGNLYRVTTDDEARGAVDAAWEGGIRMFDTAPHYGIGTSERRLGALLADRPREEYVLSTKVGRLLVPGPGDGDDMEHEFAVPDDHIRVWDMSGQGIRRSPRGVPRAARPGPG